jgi:hypothetical protein
MKTVIYYCYNGKISENLFSTNVTEDVQKVGIQIQQNLKIFIDNFE